MDYTHIIVFFLGVSSTAGVIYRKEIAQMVEELRKAFVREPDTGGLAVRRFAVGQWVTYNFLRGAERLPQGAERKVVTAAYLMFEGPVRTIDVQKEVLRRGLKWVSDIETASELVNDSNVVALYDAGGIYGLQFAYRARFEDIAHPAGGFRSNVIFVVVVSERVVS